MNKIINNRFIKVLIILFVFIFLIYGYIILLMNSDFNDFLVFSINNRLNPDDKKLFSRIKYNSLNKIVSINNSIIKESNKVVNNDLIKKEIIVDENPIIYIYNTHDTEGYYLPFISDYSISPTVKLASFILKDHLNDYNIPSLVEEKSIKDYLNKHNLDYKGCYDASRSYIIEANKKYNFKIFIDIHRDSVKYDKTLYKKDNVKYAKVLFVLALKNKNYKDNLNFINYINDYLNKYYKGLSRGILYRDDVVFNQDISNNSILLELGGVDNTIEEINNTLYIIAKILNDYISDEVFNE